MTDLLPSIIRTFTPVIYGLLIRLGLAHLLITLGMASDDTTTVISYIAGALVTIALYYVIRLLERLEPKVGILLGWIGAPQYATTVDDDLEKWRSATKAEVVEELGKVKDEILGHITDLLTTATATATAQTAAPAAVTATTTPAAATETATPDLSTLTRAELVKLLPAGVKAGKKTKAQLIAAITAANTSQAS